MKRYIFVALSLAACHPTEPMHAYHRPEVHYETPSPPPPAPPPPPTVHYSPANFTHQTYEERCGSLLARFRAKRSEWQRLVSETKSPACKDHVVQRAEYDPRFGATFIGPNERIRTCAPQETSAELESAALGVSLLTVELRQNRCNVPR